jgi:hypothetical protein
VNGINSSPIPSWVTNFGLKMRVDVVAAEVVKALRAEGMRSILLKGPTTVRLLYEHAPADRGYVDVDLLVPPPEGAAEAVIGHLGFVRWADRVPHDWPAHSVAWVREFDGAVVDVHRTFYGIGLPSDEAWQLLSHDTERMFVANTEVEAPSIPARLLIIALHAAAHGRARSKSQEDLARSLDRFDLDTWKAAAGLAARIEAREAFGTGLRLLPEGDDLAEQLGLPRTTSPYFLLRANGGSGLALFFERFASLHGTNAKLAFAARKLVPPRSLIRSWASMGPHRPSNLVLAYFLRLLFNVRGALPEFRAWVRSRKQVRS